VDIDFFSTGLAASRGRTSSAQRIWRDGVHAVIEAMTKPQGNPRWNECVRWLGSVAPDTIATGAHQKPREEEAYLRDAVQRLALAQEHMAIGASPSRCGGKASWSTRGFKRLLVVGWGEARGGGGFVDRFRWLLNH
jgi:hypothetical protein